MSISSAARDVTNLNRMFLLAAQRTAQSNLGTMVTGLPEEMLKKLAKMSLEEIERVASNAPITFFTLRLDESSMMQVLDSPASAVGALSVSALAKSGR